MMRESLYAATPDYTEIYKTITFLRFPAILLVVTLHAYTAARGLNLGNANDYFHISYVLSLCLGEMGVPLFFAISGFLFYNNYNTSIYTYKLKTRVHSLLIPYLFWNALMILFYGIMQSIPQFSGYFSGNNLPIAHYDLINFIRAFWDCGHWNAGDGLPILQPYWYIRNLMLLSILSPIIFYYLKFTKWFGVIVPAVSWIYTPQLALSLSSLTFFSLGALIAIKRMDIVSFLKEKQQMLISIFVILLIIEYFFHFYLPNSYNYYLHRITIIAGIPFLFSIALSLKDKFSISPLLTNASFLIYTIHFPIIIGIRKIGIKWISSISEGMNIILYFTSIILTTLICISIYYILNRHFPKLTRITTGR